MCSIHRPWSVVLSLDRICSQKCSLMSNWVRKIIIKQTFIKTYKKGFSQTFRYVHVAKQGTYARGIGTKLDFCARFYRLTMSHLSSFSTYSERAPKKFIHSHTMLLSETQHSNFPPFHFVHPQALPKKEGVLRQPGRSGWF